jgi:HTH-type transcriptional regulator / antitoxin MqsA
MAETKIPPLSPITGKPMVRGFRPLTITYKGRSETVSMPGWYDDDAEGGIHTGDDMKVSDAVLLKLRIAVDHLLTPEEVRRIRKKVGLSQRDAGFVIGGGPNAFQKYESGEVLVSKIVANVLRVLDDDPELIEKFKQQAYA